MEIETLQGDFSVCKVQDFSEVDFEKAFCFAARTDAEHSLVCHTADVPKNTTAREDGWRAFRVRGTLDFSLVGILSAISAHLAENGIGIFAVSTYDTDYIFTKTENFQKALDVLSKAGYAVL